MPASNVPTTTTWSLKKMSLLSMSALCIAADLFNDSLESVVCVVYTKCHKLVMT